jgi:hypothetical protein
VMKTSFKRQHRNTFDLGKRFENTKKLSRVMNTMKMFFEAK